MLTMILYDEKQQKLVVCNELRFKLQQQKQRYEVCHRQQKQLVVDFEKKRAQHLILSQETKRIQDLLLNLKIDVANMQRNLKMNSRESHQAFEISTGATNKRVVDMRALEVRSSSGFAVQIRNG